MNTLVICGNPWLDIKKAKELFEIFGVSDALGVANNRIPDINTWHEHLFTSNKAIASQIKPSKAWELAISEIFLSNWEQPLWGWVNSKSTLMLDFFNSFDPNICFILVYSPLEEALGKALLLSSNSDDFSLQEITAQWMFYTTQMLKFRNKYPQRCLLVELPKTAQKKEELIEQISQKISKEPLTSSEDIFLEESENLLAATGAIFAKKILETNPDAMALSWDSEASLDVAKDDEKKEETEASLNGALAEIALLVKQANEYASLNGQIETLQRDKAEALNENELLLLQLHQVQEELERVFIDKETLAKINDELQKERDSLEKNYVQKSKDLEEENELLLLQLHQVQEELEFYFLEQQESKQQIQKLQDKWKKVLEQYPDFCEWESAKVLSVENKEKYTTIKWQIEGLETLGEIAPSFEVSSIVASGHPALIFENIDESGFFKNISLQEGEKLTIFPTASQNQNTPLFVQMASLSTSDIQFVKTVASAIKRMVNLPLAQEFEIDAGLWVGAMELFSTQIDALEKTLRFDSLSIKNEQVNPDYEHLWFDVKNLSFGQKKWSSFEFRLGAAMVKKRNFSIHPKLEFPLIDGVKPFESWYEESEDDFGEKYELRFETKSKAMDINAWRELSSQDQELVASIANKLPLMLKTLENEEISRKWSDWEKLVENMRLILAESVKSEVK